MKSISSRTNETIKHIASLHTKKYRDEHKEFIAEGLRTCQTLVESGVPLLDIMITKINYDAVSVFVDDENITIVPDMVMEKISGATSPSGIVGVFKILSPTAPLTAGLVLAQISDPGNMGTLIRTAAAMNIKTVVCVEGADPYSPKVIQASAGTIGHVAIHQLSWHQLIKAKNDLILCALTVTGGKAPTKLSHKNILLIIGSEAHGIPNEWLNDCQEELTIEMPGNTESLNAAIAGSIASYVIFNK